MMAFEKEIDLKIDFYSGYNPFVWSPDSRYIAFSIPHGKVGIVDIETSEVREIPGFIMNKIDYLSNIDYMAWSPDQKLLAVASTYDLKIIRLSDSKVINDYSVDRERLGGSLIWFADMVFSEDGTKLLIVSPTGSDYALVNSFDLATNTIAPLLFPPVNPLDPPQGYSRLLVKDAPSLLNIHLTRYKGHIYYSAIFNRLQEYWDYIQQLPVDEHGKRNTWDIYTPEICMVADLGNGKEVRSVSVLNFPELRMDAAQAIQDKSEYGVGGGYYHPPSEAVVILRHAPYIHEADGTWKWNPNYLIETFSLKRKSIVRFAETWKQMSDEQALHPFRPLMLYGQIVPVDAKLRDAYLADNSLDSKVPITVELVLWDILTGREVDRIRRHQSYPLYKNAPPLGLSTTGLCFSPDGKHFTYYQGGGNLLPIYKVTVTDKED